MFPKDEFRKYAVKHLGISGQRLDDFARYNAASMPMGMTPNVIEERQMNISVLDVFSRLMMDRIIFLGSEINDEVATSAKARPTDTEPFRNTRSTWCSFIFPLSKVGVVRRSSAIAKTLLPKKLQKSYFVSFG